MSIEREGDMYFLYCDVCGEAADSDFFKFDDAVEYKKSNGWKSRKYGGEWEDVCPECQEEN